MNTNEKMLAYRAIDENVKDSTARQIIRYVLECELFGIDIINPNNSYLAKKYDWSDKTTRVAISLAKKSQFISITNQKTGSTKNRVLKLNIGFLKEKMVEKYQKTEYQKTIKTEIDFSDCFCL